MLKGYLFKTEAGVFRLLPVENAQYALLLDDEWLDTRHEPASLVSALHAGETKFPASKAASLGVPSDLSDWEEFPLSPKTH